MRQVTSRPRWVEFVDRADPVLRYNGSMNDSERLALSCVAHASGRVVTRNRDENDVPDLETLDAPTWAIEVKQLTVEEALALTSSFRRQEVVTSEKLTKSWHIIWDVPMLDDKLRKPRTSQPVPDEYRKGLEAAGFRVEDDSEPPASRVPKPVFKGNAKQRRELEDVLAGFEEAGMDSSRESPATPDHARLRMRFHAVVGAAMAVAHPADPDHGLLPGYQFALGSGGVATGEIDEVVGRVEQYVAGDDGESLRFQLEACTSYAERHAFLVLDRFEPEAWRSDEWDTSTLPSRVPDLPDMIDVLWFSLAHLCWCWRPDSGWSASEVPPQESNDG